jgi:hypothetical protein
MLCLEYPSNIKRQMHFIGKEEVLPAIYASDLPPTEAL